MGQGMLLGDRIYVAQATRQPALASCILGLWNARAVLALGDNC